MLFKLVEWFRWLVSVAVATMVNYMVFTANFPNADWVVYPFTVAFLVLGNGPLLMLVVEAVRNAVRLDEYDRRRR